MDTAVEQLRRSATTLQQQMEALIASVTSERARLVESSEMLQRERDAFEDEKQRVSQVSRSGEL